MYLTFNYVVRGIGIWAQKGLVLLRSLQRQTSRLMTMKRVCRHHDGAWIYLILSSSSEAEVSCMRI